MRRAAIAGALMVGSSLAVTAQQLPAGKPMAYETYCRMERAEKRAAFKSMPAEHRAALMRTHLEKWREANKATLTEAQLAFLKEMAAATSPAMFGGGTEAEQAKARDVVESLETTADAVFTNDQRRALRYDAPCAT